MIDIKQVMNVSSNRLTGSVPSLSALNVLQTIDLHNNFFGDASLIGDLSASVQTCDFSMNALVCPITLQSYEACNAR